jgi:hypothetical protein
MKALGKYGKFFYELGMEETCFIKKQKPFYIKEKMKRFGI